MSLLQMRIGRWAAFILTVLISVDSFAGPAGGAIQGTLTGPSGAAITNPSVDFAIQILDAGNTCVMYQEEHLNVDLSTTNGDFSLNLGEGTSSQNFVDGTTVLKDNVFRNDAAIPAFAGCAGGLNPAAGDGRLVRVRFNVGSGYVLLTPDLEVQSSPYAVVANSADKLQGKTLDLSSVSASAGDKFAMLWDQTLNRWVARAINAGDITSAAGQYLTYAPNNVPCAVGQVLKWTASNRWECAADNAGSAGVIGIVAGTGLTGGTITIAGTLAVNVGTGPNQIVQLNGTSQLPAVDASLLTNVNASAIRGNTVASTAPALNQVLKWNGSSWAPAADSDSGGDITSVNAGTGLTGGAIFGDATLAVDVGIAVNQIPQLKANGALGIGTATPATGAIADFFGSTAADSAVVVPRATTATRPASPVNGMIRYNTSLAKFEAYENGGWTNMVSTGGSGDFLRNGTLAMTGNFRAGSQWISNDGDNEGIRIDNSGQVGIGTTTFTEFVNVFRDANSNTRVSIQNPNAGAGASSSVAVGSDIGLAELTISSNAGGNYANLQTSAAVLSIHNYSASGLVRLTTNGIHRQTINAVGNIAMGDNANPTLGAQLDLNGTGVNFSSLIIPRDTTANRPNAAVNGMIRYNTNLSRFEAYQAGAWASLATGSGGTGDFLADGTVPMTGQFLSTVGTAGAPGMAFSADTDTGVWSNGANRLALSTAGTGRVFIDNQGRMGIGTNNPAYSLHALGTFGADAGGFTSFTVGDGGSEIFAQATNFNFYANGNNVLQMEFGAGQNMRLQTDAGYALLLQHNGNGKVAIGTTTANDQSVLDVRGTGNISNLIVPRGTSAERALNATNGMLRYNTNLSKFEVYQNAQWIQMMTGTGTSVSSLDDLSDAKTSGAADVLFLGTNAGNVNTGTHSIGIGRDALAQNTTGAWNIAIGVNAGGYNTTGDDNVFIGDTAGWGNGISGGRSRNTMVGSFSGYALVTGADENTAFGFYTGDGMSGDGNTLLGFQAGNGGISGNRNIAIGYYVQLPSNAASNQLTIGNLIYGLNVTGTGTVVSPGRVGIATNSPNAGAVLDVFGTGNLSSMLVPRGTTAERAVTAANGMLRYNTSTSKFEVYQNNGWIQLMTGSGSAGDFLANGSVPMTGQFLSTVGTANTPGMAFSGDPDTGVWSYGANRLALSTGGAGRAFVDSTGNFGIGTASPQLALDVVKSDSGNDLIRLQNTAANGYSSVGFHDTGGIQRGGMGFGNSGAAPNLASRNFIYNASGTDFVIESNSIVRFAVNSTGQIGIGTDAPNTAAVLDVRGTGNFSSMIVPRGTTAERSVIAANGMIRYNTSTSKFEGYEAGSWTNLAGSGSVTFPLLSTTNGSAANPAYSFSGDTNTGVFAPGADQIALSTAGTARVTIDSVGFVGIGTTTLLNTLTIGSSTDTNLTLGFTPSMSAVASPTQKTVNSVGDRVVMWNNGIAKSSIGVGNWETWFQQTGDPQAHFSFYVGDDSSGPVERVRFEGSGAVGIGTNAATPGSILDLRGLGTGLSSFVVPRDTTANRPAGANGMIRYNTNISKFEVYQNGSWANMATGSGSSQWLDSGSDIYYSSGNVGVGTANPSTAFQVQGGISQYTDDVWADMEVMQFSNSKWANLVLLRGRGTSTSPTYVQSGDTLGALFFRNHALADGADVYGIATENHSAANAGTAIGFGVIRNGTNSGYEAMRISSDGNVGIGTNVPQDKLSVYGTGSTSVLVEGMSQSNIWVKNDDPVQHPVIGTARYHNGGNAQSGDALGELAFHGEGAGWRRGAQIIAEAEGNFTPASAPASLLFATTPTGSVTPQTRVRIQQNGFVGIGTDLPEHLLDVTKTTAITNDQDDIATLRAVSTGAMAPNFGGVLNLAIGGESIGTVNWRRGSTNTTGYMDLFVKNNGTWVQGMTIAPDGKVGLGNSAPTDGAILDLYGTAALSSMIVPRDTTAARPMGVNGMLRYNTNLAKFEVYAGGTWTGLVTENGAGSNSINGLTDGFSDGISNLLIGMNSPGTTLTTGVNNTAVGFEAMDQVIDGNNNTAYGTSALTSMTNGNSNTAVGSSALSSTTSGYYNTAVGNEALSLNNTGAGNAAMGTETMARGTTASQNTGMGNRALFNNDTGNANVAVGHGALEGSTLSAKSNNVALGYRAGFNATAATGNIFVGYQAGDNVTSGANNIVIGYDVDLSSPTSANTLNIGNLIYGIGVDGTGTTPSNGNVGIGTASPKSRLHVHGDVTLPRDNSIQFNAYYDGQNKYLDNDSAFALYHDASNDYITLMYAGSGAMNSVATFTPGLVMNHTGKVGIGTGAPATALDVNGQIRSGFLAHSSANTNWNAGNIQSTSVAATTLTFTSGTMHDGANYVLILTSAGTFTLSTAGDITTWRCQPACASNQIAATGHTILTILKAGTTGYVSWTAGF